MTQLVLFDPTDPRPLPEVIASLHGFALAYHEDESGNEDHRWYAIQDWIAGVSHTENPRRFWADAKKQIKKVNRELYDTIVQLPYRANNGRNYKLDHIQAEGLYGITQQMDAKTGLRNKILRYLAKAGVRIDEERRDPAKTFERGVAAYQLQGKDNEWIETRFKAIDTFKQLTASIQRICDAPQYGELINTEYMELFGSTAAELQRILKTKSIRDSLPALQLSYVETAERAVRTIIQHQDRMTQQQLIGAFVSAVRPLGTSLYDVCHIVGIDRITGKPLLNGATQ